MNLRRIRDRILRDIKQIRIAICLLLIYGIVAEVIFKKICPVVIFTGYPCPGCGLTRGVLAIIRCDYQTAIRYNATSILWLIFIIWFCYKRYIKGYDEIPWERYVIPLAICTIGYYCYRMYRLFPTSAPLVYYRKNIMQWLIHKFSNI